MRITFARGARKKTTKYERVTRAMTVIVIVVFVLIATIPAALQMMYRADAQVALGNAKSVRFALQVVAKEAGAFSQPFGDGSGKGGVAEGCYEDVLFYSKAPGDFWVLQTDESGYEVERFIYREGDFTVYYEAQPSSYEVYRNEKFVDSDD